MQLNASTDGTLYARQSADGLCVHQAVRRGVIDNA
jgi:hypothetical protein